MAKQRIVRQKAAEEDGDESDLGGDVAMVGSVDDNIIVVSDDDDDKTKTVEDGGEGDDWDLPASKKGGQVPARTKAEETDEEGEEEDDLRTAYDEGDEGLNERRTPSRRSRRNRSRRESLEARDAEIMQLRGVVGQMAEQMQRLQHGQLGIAANTVDGQLSSARQAVALADQEMAKAVTEGDGKKYAEIMALRDEAAQRVWQLSQAKARLESMPRQQQQGNGDGRQPNGQPQPQGQSAAVAASAERMANVFLDRNPWFDPQGTDRDSRMAKLIDQELAEEGYQTHTKAFWQEFERRCKEASLGSNYQDDDDDGETEERTVRRQPVRRSGGVPPTGAVRSISRPGRGGFTLSATQMDLLREEGLDSDSLSEGDQKRKDRIVAKWRAGAAQLRRAGR
jgi:hypothetical protein